MKFNTSIFTSSDKKTIYCIKEISVNDLSKNDFGIIENEEFFNVRYTAKNEGNYIESILLYHNIKLGLCDFKKIKDEIMKIELNKLINFEELPDTLQYLTNQLIKSVDGMYFMDTPLEEFCRLHSFKNLQNDCDKYNYLCDINSKQDRPYITVYAGAVERINFINQSMLLDRYLNPLNKKMEMQ